MSSFTQNLTNFVTRQVESVREMTAPVLRESKFVEKGVLTPDEFVQAGDLLVYKCPTWEWCTADKSKLKSYLPANFSATITCFLLITISLLVYIIITKSHRIFSG